MSLRVRMFEAQGFRSLRNLRYPLSDLDVFVGPNGVGKTNLYRALELVQSAAANTLAADIAREGGLPATIFAGPRPKGEPVQMRLAVELDGPAAPLRYEVVIGLPPPLSAAFAEEAQVKEESVTALGGRRPVKLLMRDGPLVKARDDQGRLVSIDIDLLASETILGRLEDPSRHPELDLVRRALVQWRFYHGLRTDPASPLRRAAPAVATPSLASDGADLAAVFATLAHIRQDTVDLDEAVDDAFPGARLFVPRPERTASFSMVFPEFPERAFEAAELSDGNLRYLALAGALLAYRLPPFLALNEPESSLHPDLMTPLARLIARASRRTQVWLVTHSETLAEAVRREGACNIRRVIKVKGATHIQGLRPWGEFPEDEDGAKDLE